MKPLWIFLRDLGYPMDEALRVDSAYFSKGFDKANETLVKDIDLFETAWLSETIREVTKRLIQEMVVRLEAEKENKETKQFNLPPSE